jgi:flagellar hook-associated protein 1 FlgK
MTAGRTASQFTAQRVMAEAAKRGSAEARAGRLAGIEAIVAPETSGVRERLSAFMGDFSLLAANGADAGARQVVLADAQALAGTVRDTAEALQQQRGALLTDAHGVIAEINERTSKIAELNGQILRATASGDAPSDLLDTRDNLVREVVDRIGGTALRSERGEVTLWVAGTTLVDGTSANALVLDTDTSDSLRLRTQAGSTLQADGLAGTYGGLREVRDVDLPATQASLDTFAFELANRVNQAHRAGVGLDGVAGRDLFSTSPTAAGAAITLSVSAGMTDAKFIAAASDPGKLPGGGDVATVIAGLERAVVGGTSLGGLAAATPTEAGVRRAGAEQELALREDTLQQADFQHSSVVGVSIDEEMIQLSKFQQAYQAQSRALAVADELLSDLMRQL